MSDARTLTLALLDARAVDATICPSEVARAIGGAEWRGEMAAVHVAVDQLAGEGAIRLSWQGKPMAVRDGPYRIARAGDQDRAGGAADG